jgi:hypothetical protein
MKGGNMKKTAIIILMLGLCFLSRGEMRAWKLPSGETLEAEYESIVMDNVWLKTDAGEVIKLPLSQLTPADQAYVQYLNPPKLKLDFWSNKKDLTNYYKTNLHRPSNIPPDIYQISFKARVRRADRKVYPHKLHATYYAIGRQRIDQRKYILLEKKKATLLPAEQEEIEWNGSPIKMREYNLHSQKQGREYAYYLVTVTDERGEMIAHKESASWLFEYLSKLDELPVGAFLDNNCTRVHPTGPKPNY